MARVLVVDDDGTTCEIMVDLINVLGHDAVYSLNLGGALEKMRSEAFDLVFLDVHLPDGNGLNALPRIKESAFGPEVIIITGSGDKDGAELAMKSGCWDYLEKPLAPKNLIFIIQRALKYREEKGRKGQKVALNLEGIVGESPQLKRCFNLVATAANTDTNTLIKGETGTGKELFARAIHRNSKRAERAFVVVDCAAMPETLFESLLFGHEKGAFTGADRSRRGLIHEADKGTLFLDEIGELPHKIQGTFLRLLQERTFRPLGDTRESKSDFRLIAATNRNLEKMAAAGDFRSDLLFRIKSVVIEIPPLKNRGKDIVDLTFHSMKRFCDRQGIAQKGFSPEFLEALFSYSWPGNVRELIHAIERSLSMARNENTLYPVHLPVHIRTALTHSKIGKANEDEKSAGHNSEKRSFPDLKTVVEEAERRYLKDLVFQTGGNIKEVCRISGLSQSNVYSRLKKYDLTRRF